MSTIKVEFIADAEHLRRVMANDIPRDAQSMADKVERAGERMARTGDRMSVGLTAPLVLIGQQSAETALRFEQMGQKAETVFADQLGSVEAWADTNASAMGLARQEAVGLAANFADLLIPMGFARDEAAEMSTETLQLAGALSEWSGGQRSAAEVADILSAAMLGEREALKSLGISITEADVQARLAANGQEELTGALGQQAAALATQELILEKSTDAQAQFAAGGNETVRSMNEAKAALSEASAEIGAELLPVMADAAGVVGDLVGAFTGLPDGVQTSIVALGGFVAAAGPVMSVGGRMISNFRDIGSFLARSGPWGIAIGAAAVGVGLLAKSHIEAQQRVQDYTAAIEADSGALGDNTRATVENAIVKEQLYTDLARLGISTEQFIDAVLGHGAALETVGGIISDAFAQTAPVINEVTASGESLDNAMQRMDESNGDLWGSVNRVNDALGRERDAMEQTQEEMQATALAQSQASEIAMQHRDALAASDAAGRAFAGQLLEGRGALTENATAAAGAADATAELGAETDQAAESAAELASSIGGLLDRLELLDQWADPCAHLVIGSGPHDRPREPVAA